MPEWTPLLTSGAFDGIRTDLGTASTAMLSILLICLGVAVIWKILS